jgi:hypothetical protein
VFHFTMTHVGVSGDALPSETALPRASNDDVTSNSEDQQLLLLQDRKGHVAEDDVSSDMDYNVASDVGLTDPSLTTKDDVASNSVAQAKERKQKMKAEKKKLDSAKRKADALATRKAEFERRVDEMLAKDAQFKLPPAATEGLNPVSGSTGRRAIDVVFQFGKPTYSQQVTTAVGKVLGPKSHQTAGKLASIASKLDEYCAMMARTKIRKEIRLGCGEIAEEIRALERELRASARVQVQPTVSEASPAVHSDNPGTSPVHVAKRRRVSSTPSEAEGSKVAGTPGPVSDQSRETKVAPDVPNTDKKKRRKKRKPKSQRAEVKSSSVDSEQATTAGSGWTVVGTQKREPKGTKPTPKTNTGAEKGKLRIPRTEAVIISAVKEGMTHAEVLRLAKGSVDPVALSARIVSARQTKAGDLLLEVKGKEAADTLAQRLKEAVKDVATIRRPQITREVMLLKVDPSASIEETQAAIRSGIGLPDDGVVAVSLLKARNGTQCARVSLPLAEANKLAGLGSIQVGWTRARVKVMERRPLRCFRCLGEGHVAKTCRGPDRTGCCYRCGVKGHTAKGCKSPPRCVLCASTGKPAGHTVGSGFCFRKKDGKKKSPK